MPALRWCCLAALVIMLAAPVLAQDGQCNRCGVRVGGVAPGEWTGMSRAWRGLCERCKDPARRCGQAIEALRDRIRESEARLREFQDSKMRLEASGQADPLEIQAWEAAILDVEIDLADMRALLARLEQECAARGASDMAQGLNPGTRPGSGSNERRDAETGSAPWQRGVDTLEDVNPGGTGSDGSNVGRDSPTGATALPAEAWPEGAYLQGLGRYAAAGSPRPGGEVRISEQGLPEPVLAEVPRSRPPLERAELFTANVGAYAQALERTGYEAQAALEAGDRERALALLDHALILATEGQKAGRDARQQRLQALRSLQKLAGLVTGSPAEEFAAWQSRSRTEGLPAGLREELLSIDPREAAVTHYRLQMDARTMNSKPPNDAEWDLASVGLVHRIAGR